MIAAMLGSSKTLEIVICTGDINKQSEVCYANVYIPVYIFVFIYLYVYICMFIYLYIYRTD